jgi:hypothetical protein
LEQGQRVVEGYSVTMAPAKPGRAAHRIDAMLLFLMVDI